MSDYAYSDNPAIFWDLYGEQGHPIRTTISEMGPLLLARLLDLERYAGRRPAHRLPLRRRAGAAAARSGRPAGDAGLYGEHASELTAEYGNVTKTSVGTIQRQLLSFDSQGAGQFFGEPALEDRDFIKLDEQGRGYINVLAADKLMRSPKLYATFLLWLLAELFETLPEVGDPEKPKLVFFFDEAHLLFDDAPEALEDKIEQVVRLIRSKGVGVYFVTQNPIDIPEEVAGQLGNRVQHALARLHAQGPEGDSRRRRNLPDQSRSRCRNGDHRAENRRGIGLDPDGGRIARHCPAHPDQAAAFAPGADYGEGACNHAVDLSG